MIVRISVFILILSQAFLAAQNKTLTMEEMHRLHQDSKAYIDFWKTLSATPTKSRMK